jgi:hypothetical protein
MPSKPIDSPVPQPKDFALHSTLSPGSPPSQKQVRFADRSTDQVSRILTPEEAWSLYHYETHARGCGQCRTLLLCTTGRGLAQDVGSFVRQRGREICSTRPNDDGTWIRVEIPRNYSRTKAMLGAKRKRKREKEYAPTIVTYDTEPRPDPKQEPRYLYIEPARTRGDDRVYSIYKDAMLSPRVRYDSEGEPTRLPERSRMDTRRLFENTERPLRDYRIEVRTPGESEGDQDRERKERELKERREMHDAQGEWGATNNTPGPKVETSAARQTTHNQPSVFIQRDRSIVRETEILRYVSSSEVDLVLATAEDEHVVLPRKELEYPGAEHATVLQATPTEVDTVLPNAGIENSISTDIESCQHSTELAASDSSSSRSKSSSLHSLVLSAGCYTATDAFTTAPSADRPGHKSIGHEARTLTDFDASTIGLPPNVNQEYASAFARCLKEAVGMNDEQTSLLVASDAMVADTLQIYASMLGSLPGTQHHTAVKFVHRQRK